MRKLSVPALSLAALATSALPAFAHTGVGATSALANGLAHPLTGLDHLLAMVAVGVLAATIGGRALLAVPAAFVAMMVVGALLGLSGVALPGVELMVAASVALLGGLIAAPGRPGMALGALLVAGFALFHGHAHGAEMPADASGLGYFSGFALATMLLHLAGIGLAIAAARLSARAGPLALRAAGGVVAAVGLVLVLRVM